MAVHQWAQCWYGTWRADTIAQIPRDGPTLRTFHYLETLRLNYPEHASLEDGEFTPRETEEDSKGLRAG